MIANYSFSFLSSHNLILSLRTSLFNSRIISIFFILLTCEIIINQFQTLAQRFAFRYYTIRRHFASFNLHTPNSLLNELKFFHVFLTESKAHSIMFFHYHIPSIINTYSIYINFWMTCLKLHNDR